MLDIIIVGGGPAGLTAAIYARRSGKTVLVIEKETFGGQITFSPKVENIPGFVSVSGNEFAEKLVDQAIEQEVEFKSAAVSKIEALPSGGFLVTASGKTYESRTLIWASGARHRTLNLPNEEKYIGNGISFCAVCDGAFYKDRTVLLVGGGNSALQEAVLLKSIAAKVIVLQDLPVLTGEKALQEELYAAANVEIHCSTRVEAYVENEDGSLKGLRVRNKETEEETVFAGDGIFLAVGLVPQNEVIAMLADLDERGYVKTDETCHTKTRGLFAAGDCRTKKVRQVVTAAGDGAVAALAAADYLEGRE